MSDVARLYPKGTPDLTLESCKGHFQDVLVIGYDENGDLRAYSSEGISKLSEINYLVDVLKNALMTGYFVTEQRDDDDDG